MSWFQRAGETMAAAAKKGKKAINDFSYMA
jgi:hypothetical protein